MKWKIQLLDRRATPHQAQGFGRGDRMYPGAQAEVMPMEMARRIPEEPRELSAAGGPERFSNRPPWLTTLLKVSGSFPG